MFRRKVGKVLGDHQLGFNLDQRPSRSSQKIMEFIGREARLPFGNVRWNSNRRSPQLAGQPIKFVPRKCFAGAVNVHDKIHRLLPGDQVPV